MVICVFHPHSSTSRMSPVREVIAATAIQTRPSRQSAGRFVVAILVCMREDKGWLQEPVWCHKEAVLHSVGLILVSESSVFNLYFNLCPTPTVGVFLCNVEKPVLSTNIPKSPYSERPLLGRKNFPNESNLAQFNWRQWTIRRLFIAYFKPLLIFLVNLPMKSCVKPPGGSMIL